ncbi:proline--tRNA ligase [Rubrivirga sp. IMCC45206]|uniref:proline--tRNA ligase n=1 Tax=Rubrivirga sp. IMCC45206 TaxID=3391614 RepID=UPI00398FAB5F
MAESITPRADDYNQWYQDVVRAAKLAETSPVRGSMVLPPNGYELWENMRTGLDGMFKATGHRNAYFPLFIPKSFLAKEAEHVEGFAKECAVVTHYRLKEVDGDLVVDPDAELEEPLIVRPTSETIIWDTYSRWIQSWRDLPLKLNQWANVVRWEMRTRLFLRTAEFLWQEGHTAHATEAEAVEETTTMLDVYARFAEEWMAMPVLKGVKTASERFPGAVDTYCIEALMQDGKALQAGTSHFLGQNFAKAFDCTFQNEDNEQEYVWATSWGVSTRLIGALIMTHGDDDGVVMPPRLAPVQVAIVPITRKNKDNTAVMDAATGMRDALMAAGIRVVLDDRDQYRPGWKFAQYEVEGVPVRLAIGPRDAENGTVEVARRDGGEKETVGRDGIVETVRAALDAVQAGLYERALAHRTANTFVADDYDAFKTQVETGGFVLMHWDGTAETEARIKDETKATIRCVPFPGQFDGVDTEAPGIDPVSGAPSAGRVVFARSY